MAPSSLVWMSYEWIRSPFALPSPKHCCRENPSVPKSYPYLLSSSSFLHSLSNSDRPRLSPLELQSYKPLASGILLSQPIQYTTIRITFQQHRLSMPCCLIVSWGREWERILCEGSGKSRRIEVSGALLWTTEFSHLAGAGPGKGDGALWER